MTVVGDGQIGIAEQVRPAGLSTARPRYFEDEGLPTRAGRSQAGYRVYRENALHWVSFTQRQTIGPTLREIQPLTQEPSNQPLEHAWCRGPQSS